MTDPVTTKAIISKIEWQFCLYTEQQKRRKCLFRSSSITLRRKIHSWYRSTSQNEIRAKCYLDICLSNCTVWYSLYTFLHTPPVSKTANVKTWLTFIQSNIANLVCVSFAVQYFVYLKNNNNTNSVLLRGLNPWPSGPDSQSFPYNRLRFILN